jgi:hypothetical protein
MRLESISRANKLIYEQTDKMKMLKSQQLFADVIYTRQHQIQRKEIAKESEFVTEQGFHEKIIETVKRGDQEEEEKLKVGEKV